MKPFYITLGILVILAVLFIAQSIYVSNQVGTPSNYETYTIGESIFICPNLDEVDQDITHIFFMLQQLDSNKSESKTTWTSSPIEIKECYDLSEMKWDLSFSSLGTDHNLSFYDKVNKGNYLLKTSIGNFDPNSNEIQILKEEYTQIKIL
ncbi:MAG: hypothetical protein KKH88_04860 [Nanoarchaeota archaeon]|nr:hypothetical protein [Nanoarchaeota archaeon]